MMDYLDLGIASFVIVFFAGIGLLLIVMLLYYVNYKYNSWEQKKMREAEALELQEQLESYKVKSGYDEDDDGEIEYNY
jgi:hypothetical protein